MPLSQLSIINAKPKDKPYMLLDGEGLHLQVSTTGSRLWRIRFRFGGKANMMSLGAFPAVSLKEAREKRDQVRKQVAAGINPSLRRKLDKISAASADTFGAVADEYLANLKANEAAEVTITKNRWLLEELAAPIRNRPVGEIVPAELLDILKKIEASGRRDTAHRLRSAMGSVFRLAVATLRATNDPTYALRGALLKVKVKHRAAIIDERDLGRFLTSLDEYDGWPILQSALQFLILTMARPGDVRHMRRIEVDFPKRLWRIPGERMKMRRPHDVPLSRQALAVLKIVWPLNEENDLVFPSLRSHKKPLSENAFNSVLRNMGYTKDQATAHGFRSTASTILNERGHDDDVIEAALAHQDEDEMRRIYNRALYLPERKKLMQDWADLLDTFRQRAPLRRKAA
ncbi:tyrosine-type recombinase/integrase [Bradyrhizobium sp. INPA03-11B]|uniref:tyrosine-type recombinase/integrase n=1 Tax=Bradyrhizobium sp. INPA03-11B TaxID=418598 RepID=UPI00339067CA